MFIDLFYHASRRSVHIFVYKFQWYVMHAGAPFNTLRGMLFCVHLPELLFQMFTASEPLVSKFVFESRTFPDWKSP